ncbi:MAG: S8 family peptidase [Chloroflexota bacterium]
MTVNQMLFLRQIFRLSLMMISVIVMAIITADFAFASSVVADLSTYMQLIHFQPDMTMEMRQVVISQMGGEMVEWIDELNVARVSFSDQVVVASSADSSVILIEGDGAVHGTEAGAVESGASDKEENKGTSKESTENATITDAQASYALDVIGSVDAWSYTMGDEDVIIAVIDTGVKMDHPEFENRIVPGYDFVNRDNDPTDDHGHGTHTAGIIAASMNNDMGAAGVCPKCSIMPIKVLNEFNIGSWSSVAEGIVFAADNGAQIINLSLGAPMSSRIVERAIDYAQEKGVMVIAASGNSSTDAPFYPAALDGVMAVSATTADDTLWSSSNFGDYIDVSAPGDSIFNAYHQEQEGEAQFTHRSGTSMAAPHVAGLAGLLLSQDETRTSEDLSRLIIDTADDLGDEGCDEQFGNGRINALSALSAEGVLSQSAEVIMVEEGAGLMLGTAPEQATTNQIFLPVVMN